MAVPGRITAAQNSHFSSACEAARRLRALPARSPSVLTPEAAAGAPAGGRPAQARPVARIRTGAGRGPGPSPRHGHRHRHPHALAVGQQRQRVEMAATPAQARWQMSYLLPHGQVSTAMSSVPSPSEEPQEAHWSR